MGEMSELLRRSLVAIASDAPANLAAFQNTLGDLPVQLAIGGERFWVTARPAATVHDGVAEYAPVQVETDRLTVLDVIGDRIGLATAVKLDRVRVIGPLNHVATALDALIAYASGAVRSPSAADLVDELRHADGSAR